MGAVTKEGIAIAELVVYIPTALAALFVALRHGFKKHLGWVYLSAFSVVRIVGAALQIASHQQPANTGLLEGALILENIGLTPLLLASLGLLNQVIEETARLVHGDHAGAMQRSGRGHGIIGILVGIFTKQAPSSARRSGIITLLHIPIVIGLILSIAGGTNRASSNDINGTDWNSGTLETRIGAAIYIAVYGCLVILSLVTPFDFHDMGSSQRRLFCAILVALPFIACRLMYNIIGDFTSLPKFSALDGSPAVQLGLAIIEEFVVVLVYTIVGLMHPKVMAGSDQALPMVADDEMIYYARGQPRKPTPYDSDSPVPGNEH